MAHFEESASIMGWSLASSVTVGGRRARREMFVIAGRARSVERMFEPYRYYYYAIELGMMMHTTRPVPPTR